MSPRTEEQLQNLRDERRTNILGVALELFAEIGYVSTSVSAITKAANISKGLLYNYFKSKEELLISILHEGLSQMMDVFDPNKKDVLTKEEMVFFIRQTFKLLKEQRQYWKLYFSLFTQPTVYELVKKEMGSIHSIMATLFVEYFKRVGSKDPLADAYIIGCLMDGVSFQYILEPDEFPLDQVVERIVNLYERDIMSRNN